MTEDQAASELLKRWGAQESPEPKEFEQTESEQPDEGTQEEAEADDPDGAESDDFEIDVAGEKFKLPPALAEQAKRIESKVKEIEAGATKRFQEAAELRKVAESERQSVKQFQEFANQQADLIADHRSIMRRLAQIEAVDINELGNTDPVQLTKVTAEYNRLLSAKQRVEQTYQQAKQKADEHDEQQQTAKLERLGEYAAKNIKGWNEDYSRTLLDFSVKHLGADPQELRKAMSEPYLKALDLAYRGWKVTQADPKPKQVVSTKTLKPGAAGQMKSNAQQMAEKATQRLKKSGSTDDAAAAILARLSARRR